MGAPWGRRLYIASVLALLSTACGAAASTSANQSALANGAKTEPLAGGPLQALPTGNLFIRIVEFHQAVGASFPSTKHVPGIIFQAAGSQVLAIQDGLIAPIGQRQAFFLGPLAHTHSNPGPIENHWYFMALWSTIARSSPLVSSSAQVAYETLDFALTAFAPGQYAETLRSVNLVAGGRTSAAKYGGVETLFVLDGSISIHAAGKAPLMRAAGQGATEEPGTAIQIFNQAGGRSAFLAFYITAMDQPFETPVDRSP